MGRCTRREGIYPEAIEADVSPERLARFFVKEGVYYRIKRELRDMVLFANHSVLRDPPFSRLDLVSCRNLLIYLNRDLQQNVFQIFHYALNPERYLFLGSSESMDMIHTLFRTVDKSHRIYQARPWRGDYPHIPPLPLHVRGAARPSRGASPSSTGASADGGRLPAVQHVEILEEYAPPSVLVDDQYTILHLSESAGRYLQVPGGTPTNHLLKLVRPELQGELRTLLFQAFSQDRAVVGRPIDVQFNGAPHRVTLAVRPRPARPDSPAGGTASEHEGLALVFFIEDEEDDTLRRDEARPGGLGGEADDAGEWAARLAEVENEVNRLRERLQTTTEEFESANEELKAANEELQSINEEYRSTTEELETSKEELQSVNEELQTVNNELKNKLEEVSRAHSDLENLMEATGIATLFLDKDLRIQRFTPATTGLFNIMGGDRGRPISHLTNRLDYPGLPDDALEVLRTLVPIEREIRDTDGRWLEARIRPYRTVDDRIDGVVLTFVNITRFKQSEAELRESNTYIEKVVDTVREGLLVLRSDLTVEFANRSFFELFKVVPAETLGSLVYDLGNGQWDIPELRLLLEEILPEQNVFNDYRVEHTFDDIGRRVMLLNARRIDHVPLILLAIEDITERERYEEEVRQNERRLQKIVDIGTVGILFFDNTGTIVDANDTFLQQVGFSREDVVERRLNWRRLTPPEWVEASEAQLKVLDETGRIGPYVKQYYRSDGSRYWFLFAGARLDDGTIVEYCIDLSEQKAAEEALRERERELAALAETLEERVDQRTNELTNARDLFAQLFHSNPLPVLITRLSDGLVFDANDAYLEYFDMARGDVVGRTGLELQMWLPEEGQANLYEQLREKGSVRNVERRTAHPSGEPHTALMSIDVVNYGGVEAAISSFVDITERKRMEEQVRQLASQLTLAENAERARIALILHDDLQQQLYSIQIQLALLRDRATDVQFLGEAAAMEDGVKLALLTARRLAVDLSPPVLDGEGLTEAIGWLAGQMKEQYGLEVTVDAKESFLVRDLDRRVLLFQTVRELLFNAVKHARVSEANVSLRRIDGAYAITVSDAGVGFDPQAVLDPVANPGARGLRQVMERLRLVGGRIEVDSSPGEGTRVTIIDPIAARA